MKIHASLTTIPSRLPHLDQSLSSILRDEGFDRVILTIPRVTIKGFAYPETEIERLQTKFGERLVIHRIPRDYGPITKLVGGLDYVENPDDIIVVFDDDRELLNKVSQLFLLKLIENPDRVYSLGGWCFGGGYKIHVSNQSDIEVDSLMGTTCIAFRRGVIDKRELLGFRRKDRRLIKLDDLRISGYLASRGVKRVSVGGDVRKFLRDLEYPNTEKLSSNLQFWLDNKSVIDDLYKQGLFKIHGEGGMSMDLFVILVLGSVTGIVYGLYKIYLKEKIGYGMFLAGLVIWVFAFFKLRSFIL